MISRILKLIRTRLKSYYDETEKEETSSQTRFDYLDGYRGTLALMVVIAHSHQLVNVKILEYDEGITHSYAIAGFFMLSAFLLTFRLLEDFRKCQNLKSIIICTLKYFTRRFVRIYIYYLFYCSLAILCPKWIGGPVKFDASLWKIALLESSGNNHLWTVPPELKYYLFIPIFCLTVRLMNRISVVLLIFSIISTIYDQVYNVFGITIQDIIYGTSTCHLLKGHFAVFFIGSQTALAYFLIKYNDDLMRFINKKPIQMAIDYLAIIIGLIGLKVYENLHFDSFRFRSRAAIFWSSVLLLTLLNDKCTIANTYRLFRFLRNMGKYSYSIYLFHFGLLNVIGLSILSKWLNWFEFALVSVFIIYCVGKVLFYLIERPLIDLASYFCKKLDSFLINSDSNGSQIEYATLYSSKT